MELKRGCIDKNNLINGVLKIEKKIGTESEYGEIFRSCFVKKNKCNDKIAIKKIPFNDSTKSDVDMELTVIKLSTFLLKNKISPHLPVFYGGYTCEKDKNILIKNKLALGDIKYYITKMNPSLVSLKRMYFQIFTAVYTMRKYFGIIHNDLHWGNVLIYKNEVKKKYIKYVIGGKEYCIKNYNYSPVIWDFGLSIITKDITFKIIDDFDRIISMLFLDSEQTNKKYHLLGIEMYNLLHSSENLNNFFSKIYDLIGEKYCNEDFLTYNTDKKVYSKDNFVNKFLI